jgi:hypothetical protein
MNSDTNDPAPPMLDSTVDAGDGSPNAMDSLAVNGRTESMIADWGR